MHSSHHFKIISQILIFAMLHLCWLTSYGYAEMVPTESAAQVQNDRQRILDLLDRQEVIDELKKYDISKVEAVARINSLTDEEVIVIAGKLDELKAGGYLYLGSDCLNMRSGLDQLILGPLCFVIFTIVTLLAIPLLILICPFSSQSSYSECVGNSFVYFSSSSSGSYDTKEWQEWNTSRQGKATSELDQKVCRFDCNEVEKACLESVGEEGDAGSGNLRCDEKKTTCFKQCEGEEEIEKVKEEVSEKVEEKPDSVLIEEVCDPGMESCP
jgi:hypothetical protein